MLNSAHVGLPLHAVESQGGIVVDCPVCSRTIWAGTTCYHGGSPSPHSGDAPKPKKPKKSGGDDPRGGVRV